MNDFNLMGISMSKNQVLCRFCKKSETIRKHGKGRSGYPRYFCTTCNKTFQLDFIYKAYKERDTQMLSNNLFFQ